MSKRAPSARPTVGPYNNAFVGRESDFAAIDGSFSAGAQLITLVGPGGIGKTRCAWEYASRNGERVVFCDLAGAVSVNDCLTALGQVLGVHLQRAASREPFEAIASALSSRGRQLVVLDNFEQLVEPAAAAVGKLMARAPDARFLITSREVLRLTAETVLELPPLTLPSSDAPPGDSEAVRLLLSRVEQLRPGASASSAGGAATAGEIAVALDGIPLALELAAPRVVALGLRAVRDLIVAQADALGRNAADAPSRHATLRAAIDWSWQALDADERAALALCSTFRGGFTLAALAGCGATGRGDMVGASEVLQRLAEKSMVRVRYGPNGVDDARYDLYGAIRDFAADQLQQAGDTDAAESAHMRYYLAEGEARARLCHGPDGASALQWLRSEHDNLSAIVERSLRPGVVEPAAAVRALLALHAVVLHHGSLASQLSRWDAVLSAAPELAPALQVRAAIARGRLRGRAGEPTQAREDLEAAVARATEIGDDALLGQALTELARTLHSLGDRQRAHAALARALPILQACGDQLLQGLAHRAIGSLESEESLSERAVASFERALSALRSAGAPGLVASTLVNLGIARLACGQLGLARSDLDDSLACCARGEALPGVEGAARGGLARLAHLEGELVEAAGHYERAIERAKAVDDRRFQGLYTGFLGLVRAEMSDTAGAISLLRAGAALLSEVNDAAYAGLFEAHAAVLAATSEPEAERARKRLDRALGVVSPSGEGADVTLARRLARRSPAVASGPKPQLSVSTTGRWFRSQGQDPVDCASHRTLRRVLVCLAREAIVRPGRVVTTNELMVTVWPDERPSPASRNRLKTLVSKLRKLGLRDVLMSDPDGYRLDDAVTVTLVSDGAEMAR